jgi:hypothetical protein
LTKDAFYFVLIEIPVMEKYRKSSKMSLRELKLFVRVPMLLLFWETRAKRVSITIKVAEQLNSAGRHKSSIDLS